MKTVGICGIGDMGSGLAKNLIAAGFDVRGFDPDAARAAAFAQMGGKPAETTAEVGNGTDAVFVMVMNGAQVRACIFGPDGKSGLASTMSEGSVIIITATILPAEIRAVADDLEGTGIEMIDSPVSGGFPGAQNGTLTMMAAGSDALLDRAKPVMEAVSGSIHRVGGGPGMGQTVKACLQSMIGSIFTATYEATVLAAKSGVDAEAFLKVVSNSSASSLISTGSIENIIERNFEKTGSHIATMYKDLTISMDHAREMGVPLFTASMAMQLFQAGKTKYPDGDNQIVTKVAEDIVGVGLTK
jgi:3-hydroxyisobutyrate dehydrogenase-like beta-hydroxyacid dehydrogenase